MSETVDPRPELVNPFNEVSDEDYQQALDELSTVEANPALTLGGIARLEEPACPNISSNNAYRILTQRYGEILDAKDIPEEQRYAYLAGLSHGVLGVGRAFEIHQGRIIEELRELGSKPGVMQAVLAKVDDEETLADPALQESIESMERGELTDITPEDEVPDFLPQLTPEQVETRTRLAERMVELGVINDTTLEVVRQGGYTDFERGLAWAREVLEDPALASLFATGMSVEDLKRISTEFGDEETARKITDLEERYGRSILESD